MSSLFTARWKRFQPEAAREFRQGAQAIVEESLLLQFHAEVGDPIKIGDSQFTIAGALKKMPGEASAAGSFAPRVYIPLQNLAGTNLLRAGSIARYRAYVKFPENTNVESRIEMLGPQIKRLGMEFDTVAKRKRDLGASLENLYRFLNLVGFISLLLGAVGVASAIQAHLQQKTRTGAILRCLGMSAAGTVLVYLVQTAAMGLFGGGLWRCARGRDAANFPAHSHVVFAARDFHHDRLAADRRRHFYGFSICILFALPPLLRFRRLSPLRVFRAATEVESTPRGRDPVLWAVYCPDRRRHHRAFRFRKPIQSNTVSRSPALSFWRSVFLPVWPSS